ncbi:MAG: hypothetical protein WCQ06_06595 [Actinomycetes bacterium]
MLRKISFSIAAVLLLAGCGGAVKVVPSTTPTPATKFVIPSDCTKTGLNAALSKIVSGSKYIATQWQPSPGTELAEFLNNGGIACSYGLQSAEIGITAKWVDDSKLIFENRESEWLKSGYTKVALDGIDSDAAYFLLKKQSPTQEFHVWSLNFKYKSAWFSLSCTSFAQSLADGVPLAKAMIAA